VFRWVKNSDNFDFFMITKLSSTYLFHKRGRSAKVSKACFSTFSVTRFAITHEMGEHIVVPKAFISVFHEK